MSARPNNVNAIHEAGHAVIAVRQGMRVRSVDIIPPNEPDGTISLDSRRGICRTTIPESTSWKGIFQYCVAGNFADLKWGNGECIGITLRNGERIGGVYLSSSDGDFENVARLVQSRGRVSDKNKIAAYKRWCKAFSELERLAKSDPTFKRQVFAVACTLEKKQKLTGDEVHAIVNRLAAL